MNPERLQQVYELYHAALERQPAERVEFLNHADPELRREVESLLTQHRDGLLNRPVWELADHTVTQLSVGTELGPYRIEAPIGSGGMGQVFRAVDTRLGRKVAIKTCQEQFSARFEREARAISALNHSNICTLYDVGPNYLVMELVDGPTLAERLKQGALPMESVLRYGAQIADALAAAHARSIVHRDLKPGNIMLAKGGVKVLDFGLAKSPQDETLTGSKVIMGTPAYMAPEQREAKECDARTDIYALGLMLYEMASGKRRQLDRPAPLDGFPRTFVHIVERCLERDPEDRWQSARDVQRQLEWAATTRPDVGGITVQRRRNLVPWALAGVLGVALVAALWVAWRASRPADSLLTRLSVDLGPNAMAGIDLTAAISPDGRRLVFRARAPNGKQQLATRLLDQAQATMLAGTENGHDPFFSPDSQWVGFFADSKLRKISVQGGAPVTLCDATFDYGASWGEDGTIIAALNVISGLSRVPAAGGSPQVFTKLGKGEQTHRWPQILPGGQAVLFTGAPNTAGMENAGIQAISLKGGATKTLVAGGYFGRYLPANGTRGYLVYLHQGVLFGVGFDPGRLELQGTPVPLLEDVAASPIQGGGQFDVSSTGTLVYLAGKQATETWPVVLLDGSGKTQPLIATPGSYAYPRFSPDGRRLMLVMSTGNASGTDIYIHELERQTTTRLTFGGHAQAPVWAPDGQHVAFRSSASGIAWVRSDGSGEPLQILTAQNIATPWSFSPDGRRLAYVELNPTPTARKIWKLPMDTSDPDHPKPGKPDLFLEGPSDENAPFFSPDGRWIAYRSNESGTDEVYVRPFPAGRGGRWQISTGGGLYGIWSKNGRELFYEPTDNRITVMDYTMNGESFVPGKPHLWSDKQIFYPGNSNLDLAPDGKRFAVFPMPEAAGPEKGSVHITLLLNFFDELRRRVPANK